MKKYDNKTIEKLMFRYFNICNFEISKFQSFKTLTSTHQNIRTHRSTAFEQGPLWWRTLSTGRRLWEREIAKYDHCEREDESAMPVTHQVCPEPTRRFFTMLYNHPYIQYNAPAFSHGLEWARAREVLILPCQHADERRQNVWSWLLSPMPPRKLHAALLWVQDRDG